MSGPTIAAMRARLGSGYAHLQSMRTCDKSASTSKETGITKMDAKLVSTFKMFENASRIEDAVQVIDDAVRLMCDGDASMNKRKQMARNLKLIVSPMLSSVVVDINEAAKSLAPIAGVPESHRKREVTRKRDAELAVRKSSQATSIEIKRIEAFVKNTKVDEDVSSPRAKKARTAKVVTPQSSSNKGNDDGLELPLPANRETMQYRKPEAVQIPLTTKKGTPKRGAMMQKMISLGYTPTTEKTLQRYLKMKEENNEVIIDDEWTGKGRKRVMQDADIIEAVKEWRLGEAHGNRSIEEAMVSCQKKLIEKSGAVPIMLANKFGRSTVDNYTCEFASIGGVSLINSTTAKTTTRFIAERSIRNSIADLALIGSTHFVSVDEEDLDIRNELKGLSEDTQRMYNYVTEIRGCPQYPVKPWLIFSTDDTKPYIFEGTSVVSNKAQLVTDESVKKSGTMACFRLDEGNSMKGMRVDMTCSFSAAGTFLPIVITVSGLTEQELPGTDFLDLEVPGLCVGGGVSTGNSQVGYVLFMRSTEKAKRKRFEWYQENILIPGINDHRMTFDEFDASLNTAIPADLTAISYCDGDIPQLDAIKRSLELFAENRVIANKQGAATSSIRQPADVCPVFRIVRQLLPHHTVRNLPPERCPAKKLVHDAFQSDKLEGLNLPPKKRNALIDFIAVLPPILSMACTVANIKKGFIENGIIDREVHRYPSWNTILSTCKRNPSDEEYLNIFDTYPDFLRQCDEEGGNADEEFHDMRNIVRDKNQHGEDVLKVAGIRQEHMQRSKCMNHPFVIEQRKAEERKHCQTKLRKMKEANAKHLHEVDANREAVFILLKKCQDDGYLYEGANLSDEENLEYCTLDTFDVLKAPQLKAFIIAHNDELEKRGDIPNRGKLQEAKADPPVNNSILMAYNCRMKPNLLEGKEPYGADELAKYSDEHDDEDDEEINVTVLRLGEEDQVLPSELLTNPLWRSNAARLFHFNDPGDVSEADQKKANLLVKLLRARLKVHLRRRIKQKSKRTHWSMRMAYKNMSVVAALMVLQSHVKMDIGSLNEQDCLLAIDLSQFVDCSECPDREGAYLYFDLNRGVFVRSGKVSGRGFGARNGEHLSAAKASSATSFFYLMFPSASSPRFSKRDKRGSFESLKQVVASGFDGRSEAAKYVDRDVSEGGVLLLNEQEKKNIKSGLKNLKCSELVKFHHILSYQMELGYDIALSPDSNVSRSPGFETVLGVISDE